jgi:hypothetical protein
LDAPITKRFPECPEILTERKSIPTGSDFAGLFKEPIALLFEAPFLYNGFETIQVIFDLNQSRFPDIASLVAQHQQFTSNFQVSDILVFLNQSPGPEMGLRVASYGLGVADRPAPGFK